VVEFEVVQGGAELDRRVDVTNETGVASTGLRLGSALGTVRVRARVVDVEISPVEFEAHAVEPPLLSSVPTPVRAGEVIEITGSSFNPVAENNVVLFDGVRGIVTAVGDTALSVRVPSCLPSRNVEVQVRVGSAASGRLGTTVEGSSERLRLQRGEVHDLDGTDGSACITLESAFFERYLLVAQSAGRVAGARYDAELRGLAADVAVAAKSPDGVAYAVAPDPAGASQDWHHRLRAREDVLARTASTRRPAAASGAVPAVGHERTFRVAGRGSSFADVEAVARDVGEYAAIYVDRRVDDVVDEDFVVLMSGLFDDPIHDVVTETFGAHSDIDGNDRIIILFTPEVNLLTDRGDDGFVAGFFFGIDLLPENGNSNEGEIFYMVAPDPNGTYSDPRLAQNLVRQLPPILAHEFQHMIHFNQRVLIRGGRGTDALWLSEGLATMAEDRFAQATEGGAYDYLATNLDRAARYLSAPSDVSLTVTAGSGTLAERGAGWLFTRYLWERSDPGLLAALTQTTLTGIENVESVTGGVWEELLADWAVAVQSEFLGAQSLAPELTYPVLNLQSRLNDRDHGVSRPETLQTDDFARTARLWAGGTAYWQLEIEGGRPLALNVGALGGGPVDPAAELRLRLVRIR